MRSHHVDGDVGQRVLVVGVVQDAGVVDLVLIDRVVRVNNEAAVLDGLEQGVVLVDCEGLETPAVGSGGQTDGVLIGAESGGLAADLVPGAVIAVADEMCIRDRGRAAYGRGAR